MAVATLSSRRLDAPDRIWPLTNCHVDLWIELLHGWDLDPVAALAFTVAQDFEGDQFTFLKFPVADLERLYGTTVQELAIYHDLEDHVHRQVSRGRVVLIEVDGFHLPDTRNASYRTEHTKTTIAVTELDATAGRCRYVHNRGRYGLDGEDYASIFANRHADSISLFPYVEMVARQDRALWGSELESVSLELLSMHLRRRPTHNPVSALRAEFPDHFSRLLVGGMSAFHPYTFNTFRQFGANHELLGHYLAWLDRDKRHGLTTLVEASLTAAETAKALQFRLARMVSRNRFDLCTEGFDTLEQCIETLDVGLAARFA